MKTVTKMLALGVLVAALIVGVALVGAEFGHAMETKSVKASEKALTEPEAVVLVMDKYPGKLIATEQEREDGRLVYEITIAANNGGTREFTVDAQNGTITEGIEEGE